MQGFAKNTPSKLRIRLVGLKNGIVARIYHPEQQLINPKKQQKRIVIRQFGIQSERQYRKFIKHQRRIAKAEAAS